MTESFEEKVWRVVCDIPPGKVATYGRVAVLAGEPGHARQVGRVLHFAPPGIPCHRVVNHL